MPPPITTGTAADGVYSGTGADGLRKTWNGCAGNAGRAHGADRHSYGGSCAVEVARRQAPCPAPLCLLTIDAVARRQKNSRPESVDWWGNSYLGEGGGFMDAVPRMGGRWGHCSGADVNLSFSGFRADRAGHPYCHRRPGPMLYESPSEEERSLYEEAAFWLRGALGR